MNDRPFIIVDVEQNTQEWCEWRKTGLGASSAATIIGENPFKSRDGLLQELLNPQPFVMTEAMELGHDLEPISRKYYQRKTGIVVKPVCLQSRLWPWLLCSLDGATENLDRAVEIKSGIAAYNRTYEDGRVPSYYRAQLQHQMAVTGLETIDFWAWWPRCPPVALRVRRNNDYIQRIVDETKKFWDELNERKNEIA